MAKKPRKPRYPRDGEKDWPVGDGNSGNKERENDGK